MGNRATLSIGHPQLTGHNFRSLNKTQVASVLQILFHTLVKNSLLRLGATYNNPQEGRVLYNAEEEQHGIRGEHLHGAHQNSVTGEEKHSSHHLLYCSKRFESTHRVWGALQGGRRERAAGVRKQD